MERLGLGDALLTVSALIVALVVRAGARHAGHVEPHLDELVDRPGLAAGGNL
jgi:hypothetical protein